MPAIHLDLGLSVFGIFATYFLRIFAAYLLCEVLSKLCFRSRLRFLIWILFVLSAGAYWVGLVARQAFGGAGSEEAVLRAGHPLLSPALGLTRWNLPIAWKTGIGEAGRLLVWGYAVIVTLLILRMLYQRLRLWLVLRRAVPPRKELLLIFKELCDRTETSDCRVLMLPGLTSPATVYTWRAQVLLPEFIETYLGKTQLEDVLCHELIHVKRRDYLWGMLAGLVQCVAFFHPAVWLALRHLHRERELACDEAVIQRRQGRRADYAECLTRLTRVRLAGERSLSTIHFATSGSFLSLRVRALLAETSRPSWWKRGVALITGMVLLSGLAIMWPKLAILLRFAPPAATALLRPKVQPQSRRKSRHHHPHRAINGATENGYAANSASASKTFLAAGFTSPSTAAPVVPANAQSSSLVIAALSARPNSREYSRPETTSPPASRGRVWSESLPGADPVTPPSWRTMAIGIAVAAASHGVVGASEGPDGGQSEQGNSNLSLPFH